MLVLLAQVLYDHIFGLMLLLLSSHLPLELLDPLGKLLELREERLVVVLELLVELHHGLALALLPVLLLPPVLLALAELLDRLVSLRGHTLQLKVHILHIRVELVYQSVLLCQLIFRDVVVNKGSCFRRDCHIKGRFLPHCGLRSVWILILILDFM